MISKSNKYQSIFFLSVSFITLLLSACGGGGSENSGPLVDNNSAPILVQSSAPLAASSSSPVASQQASSQSNTSAATSSVHIIGSEPAKPTPSSVAVSSYARSSRANDPSTDLSIYDPPPFEDEEDYVDLPPSTPKSLQLDIIATNGAVISWDSSSDDVGLWGYEVRRDGIAIGTNIASQRSFEDTGLNSNTYYTYTVRAIDIAGNRSNFSDQLAVKTITPTSSGNNSSQHISSARSFSSMSSQSQSAVSISSLDQMSSSSTRPTSSAEASSSAMSRSSAESSASVNSSSKSSSSATLSSSSTPPSSSSVSSNANVRVEWITPSSRENGAYLELDEIGGYEIRYRPKNSSFYLQEIITDKYATYYERTDITDDASFQIAVFDTNGLYSRFIQLTPQ
jgi:hypothetical protein